MITPVEQRDGIWFKRDDLYQIAGVRGGKARTCYTLAQRAQQRGYGGLVTASSRASPQAVIVAAVARALGLRARIHMPFGGFTEQMNLCVDLGGEIIQHRPGYNSVIEAAATADTNYFLIPFGMQHRTAVVSTAAQVVNIPPQVKKLVVPVGSAMTLAGIIQGLKDAGRDLPVIGVVVGANPIKRLNTFAPWHWQRHVQLVYADTPYEEPAQATSLCGIQLDPYYEAKAVPYIGDDSLFWLVGIRGYFDHENRPAGVAFIAEDHSARAIR